MTDEISAAGTSSDVETRVQSTNTTPKPSRKCGSCAVCCTVCGVSEEAMQKGPYTKCVAMSKGRARVRRGPCGIYDARPMACRVYNCYWRFGMGKWSDRPDKVGIIVDSSDALQAVWGRLAVQVREVWPGAAKGKRASAMIEQMINTGEAVVFILREDGPRGFVTHNKALRDKFDAMVAEVEATAE